ncbi:imm11 family protein [Pricia sp.]|uniref:imm11 family protein n=1 Tax=Pricia sp. TaxID=2268138 RepID=UPI003592EEBD
MNYFVWDVYFKGEGFAYCEKMNGINDTNIVSLLTGKKLENPLPDITAESFSRGSIGDIFGWAAGLVASEKIKKHLEGENVQFIPVKILSSDLKYYLANFLSAVECIDKKKSTIEYYNSNPDYIEKIRKLVLLSEIDESLQAFRILERPDVVLVCEKMKNQLQRISKSAGVFTPTEKFKIGYF